MLHLHNGRSRMSAMQPLHGSERFPELCYQKEMFWGRAAGPGPPHRRAGAAMLHLQNRARNRVLANVRLSC
jgi:hypothetical protein